jgi:hypothetical protein
MYMMRVAMKLYWDPNSPTTPCSLELPKTKKDAYRVFSIAYKEIRTLRAAMGYSMRPGTVRTFEGMVEKRFLPNIELR